MLVKIPSPWATPERLATPESVYSDRRRFLVGGTATLALAGLGTGSGLRAEDESAEKATVQAPGPYHARRNEAYALDRPLTEEKVAARFNVFDEFSVDHEQVWRLVEGFSTAPWKIHVGGLVEKPTSFDLEDLVRAMGLEERLYRHRCVEAWAMAVPWTGFPFSQFLDWVKPLSKAKYIRMISVTMPEAPGWYATRRVFPYYEALSLEEARNELAFLATGIYGHPLPAQHGAPLRLVVPWKWGLKSIKSIVAFQLTLERPDTFWNVLSPGYYTFEGNVHPKNFRGPWSQETETMLGTGEVRPTLPYNGYADQVAALYKKP